MLESGASEIRRWHSRQRSIASIRCLIGSSRPSLEPPATREDLCPFLSACRLRGRQRRGGGGDDPRRHRRDPPGRGGRHRSVPRALHQDRGPRTPLALCFIAFETSSLNEIMKALTSRASIPMHVRRTSKAMHMQARMAPQLSTWEAAGSRSQPRLGCAYVHEGPALCSCERQWKSLFHLAYDLMPAPQVSSCCMHRASEKCTKNNTGGRPFTTHTAVSFRHKLWRLTCAGDRDREKDAGDGAPPRAEGGALLHLFLHLKQGPVVKVLPRQQPRPNPKNLQNHVSSYRRLRLPTVSSNRLPVAGLHSAAAAACTTQ